MCANWWSYWIKILLMSGAGCIFAGQNISLNFQKIETRAVLQLLAEFTGINMVISDKVKGETTLSLENIPWEQALDVILATNSLEKRKTGNIMLIAPIASLNKADRKTLNTEQDAVDRLPMQTGLLQINYAKAADIASLLQDKKSSLLSGQGTLGVDERSNTIRVQDTGSHIAEIQKLTRQLDIPVKQVLIEARIVNMTRAAIQDLGIRFGVSKSEHSNTPPENDKAVAAAVPLANRLHIDFGSPAVNPASVGIALAKLGNGVLLDLELSALESESKAEIIASPRLMTINRQTATIESGEEIPYQEAVSSGVTAMTFKKAVLRLKVTPQITSDNKLLMALHINQDSLSARDINGVPAILTREIRTRVLVNNGQTVVLGGIYKQEKSKSVRRLPFLGKLPFAGLLFRNKHTEIKNEELLIFITPRIIQNVQRQILTE